jgi:hypothetical protein
MVTKDRVVQIETRVGVRGADIEEADLVDTDLHYGDRFRALVMERVSPQVYRMKVLVFRGRPAQFEMVSTIHEALRFAAWVA